MPFLVLHAFPQSFHNLRRLRKHLGSFSHANDTGVAVRAPRRAAVGSELQSMKHRSAPEEKWPWCLSGLGPFAYTYFSNQIRKIIFLGPPGRQRLRSLRPQVTSALTQCRIGHLPQGVSRPTNAGVRRWPPCEAIFMYGFRHHFNSPRFKQTEKQNQCLSHVRLKHSVTCCFQVILSSVSVGC